MLLHADHKTDLIIRKMTKRFDNIPTVKVRISVYELHITITVAIYVHLWLSTLTVFKFNRVQSTQVLYVGHIYVKCTVCAHMSSLVASLHINGPHLHHQGLSSHHDSDLKTSTMIVALPFSAQATLVPLPCSRHVGSQVIYNSGTNELQRCSPDYCSDEVEVM